MSERERGECACLTRGKCARDGSLPSSRSLWWRLENAAPAGQERRAAPSRRRPPGRDPVKLGAPAPAPGSRPPPPLGLASPSHLGHVLRNSLGRCPPASNRRCIAKERPRRGAVSLLAWQLSSETPSLRSDPSPLDFTASRVPRFFALRREPGFREGRRRGWGLGFSSGSPWLAAQKAPPRHPPWH